METSSRYFDAIKEATRGSLCTVVDDRMIPGRLTLMRSMYIAATIKQLGLMPLYLAILRTKDEALKLTGLPWNIERSLPPCPWV